MPGARPRSRIARRSVFFRSAIDATGPGDRIEVAERVAIPEDLIPDDASVEMDAKKAAGYFSESPVDGDALKTAKGRGLHD